MTEQPTTRQRILDAALDQVDRQGLTVGLEHLGLERIIAASGVSRATAYRHWPTKADFLADVLTAVVARTRLDAETEDEIAVVVALLADRPDRLETEQGRRDLLVEGLRIATIGDYERIATAPTWRSLLALHATTSSLPPGSLRDEVTTALVAVEKSFTRHRATVYERHLRVSGHRLRAPLHGQEGLEVLSEGQGALMTGLAVRALTTEDASPLVCAPFGASVEASWPRPVFHLVHLLLSHLEPDPDVVWDAERIAVARTGLDEMLRAARAAR